MEWRAAVSCFLMSVHRRSLFPSSRQSLFAQPPREGRPSSFVYTTSAATPSYCGGGGGGFLASLLHSDSAAAVAAAAAAAAAPQDEPAPFQVVPLRIEPAAAAAAAAAAKELPPFPLDGRRAAEPLPFPPEPGPAHTLVLREVS